MQDEKEDKISKKLAAIEVYKVLKQELLALIICICGFFSIAIFAAFSVYAGAILAACLSAAATLQIFRARQEMLRLDLSYKLGFEKNKNEATA